MEHGIIKEKLKRSGRMETTSSKKNSISNWYKKLENGSLTWDESIQRCSDVWKPKQKSELIHSILSGYYVPSMCFLKTGEEIVGKSKVVSYSVIDGKQRLSIIFDYMNNGFKLYKETPTIENEDGSVVEIAGKKFDELEEDLQTRIRNFYPEVTIVDNYTKEEAEILFYRLNNGTPLTKVQQSRALLGGEASSFANSLLELDFFKRCHFSTEQKHREDNLGVVLQSLMLLDESYEWKKMGAKDISEYCERLEGTINLELQCKIYDALKLLSEIFTKESVEENFEPKERTGGVPFLTKLKLPSIIYVASKLCQYNINPEYAIKFFIDFFDEESGYYKEYKKHCGEGTVSKDKVLGRNETLLKAAYDYFDLSENARIYSNTMEEVKPILNEAGFIPREYILG